MRRIRIPTTSYARRWRNTGEREKVKGKSGVPEQSKAIHFHFLPFSFDLLPLCPSPSRLRRPIPHPHLSPPATRDTVALPIRQPGSYRGAEGAHEVSDNNHSDAVGYCADGGNGTARSGQG